VDLKRLNHFGNRVFHPHKYWRTLSSAQIINFHIFRGIIRIGGVSWPKCQSIMQTECSHRAVRTEVTVLFTVRLTQQYELKVDYIQLTF